LRIHALAAELLALKDQGREEEALAQLPELFQLRDAIIDWIQQIMSASSAKD
jgi:hypothetical protein